MDIFEIKGPAILSGTVNVNGSKNASLPIMAAAILAPGKTVLKGVPVLSDISVMSELLQSIGCTVTIENDAGLIIDASTIDKPIGDYEIVRKMRASICVLGPMLAKRGKARVSMPGGCNIGDRPVDLHLRGLAALGAAIHLDEGYIVAETPSDGRLRGAHVFMGGPFGSTVLGTANVMCAAALARGVTVIESAACEPEVVDLADLLNSMGGRVSGAGSPRVTT